MATASHIELSPSSAGIYHVPDITSQSAKVATQLLQDNHEKHHIYFNHEGFHNHIAHHLLALFALGATPKELQRGYDNNKGYQRSLFRVKEGIVKDMANPDSFKTYLGKEQYYLDFLQFFQQEIEAKGWQQAVHQYLFSKTEASEDLLVRMFAGFYHPIIHLGYGVEFSQPAIVAEALAQAATHDGWVAKFLLPAERAARSTFSPSKSLPTLLNEVQSNDKLRNSTHWDDSNKVRDGILVRAPEEMIKVAAHYKVTPDSLVRKTAEMINSAIYFTAGSQRRDKEVRFDFFYMHSVTSSIFFSTFINQPWLTIEDKCRLVEWKGRFDLALYVSRGNPQLDLARIKNYQPKHPSHRWNEIFARVDQLSDDGHSSKLIRAIAHGKQVSKAYDDEDAFMIKQDTFLQIAHMAIDSVEAGNPRWVRNTGFDQAWVNVPDRARL
ncbi:hypothetical protein DV736_g2717, partial [Chaetothyriales sp. CBS 134916]